MNHLSVQTLSASLDGSLEGVELEHAKEHLAKCVLCKDHLERLVMHDDVVRRLFGSAPEERVLEDVTRRSEAVATAVLRGLPLPPLVTSLPLEDDDETEEDDELEPGPKSLGIERLHRFSPPTSFGRPTVEQDTTATPADDSNQLPPSREPSRATLRLEPNDPSAGVAPLEVAPRLDTEHAPSAKSENASSPKSEHKPLLESYDAFNDLAYAGPSSGRLPPMLGRPQEKNEGDAEKPATPREYRHGGVRRETPSGSDRPRENPAARTENTKAEPRDEGFGVKRVGEPAWVRMGLQPDPSRPGQYRDTLTGATVAPPVAGTRRPAVTRPSSSRRTAVIATLATVGGIVAAALALRVPTGAHLSVDFGRQGSNAASAAPGSLQVREAGSRPPVDVAVPPAGTTGTGSAPGVAGTSTIEEPRVCGQVLDVKGRPIAGALLTVAGIMSQARSDEQGRFCISAPAGTRLVEVMDPRGAGTATRQTQMEFVAGAPAARVVLP